MVFITVKQSPIFRQMTLEELLFTDGKQSNLIMNSNTANTKTYEVENVGEKFLNNANINYLIARLMKFNQLTDELREKPRNELYTEFCIPKKSGGLRKISKPNPELMEALRTLKTIFEEDFKALYHTSSFAYVKHRCTVDAVKRHQSNESKWFGKYDLSNFFGNTTLDFVMSMLSMVFPFSEVVKSDTGRIELEKAVELAFLDGGLPQGTPVSPIITNVMMIPIDHRLSNGLRNFNGQRFVYTRYADDFIISSQHTFKFKEVEQFIVDTLASYKAPFTINAKKTRYGSSAGSNWNLGVMLNKDNQITVGHKKKRQFQAMLASYVMDKQSGKAWSIADIQVMEGYRNYYRMIEPETIDGMIKHIGEKFGVDVVQLIKDDLRA